MYPHTYIYIYGYIYIYIVHLIYIWYTYIYRDICLTSYLEYEVSEAEHGARGTQRNSVQKSRERA